MKQPHPAIFCELQKSLSVTSTPCIHVRGLVLRHRFKPSKLAPVCIRQVPTSNLAPNTDFVTDFFFVLLRRIWRDSTSKLTGDHSLPPPFQFTIHDTMIWLLTASLNKWKQWDSFTGAQPYCHVDQWRSLAFLFDCTRVPLRKSSRTVPRWLAVQWPFRMLSGLICASIRECGVLFHVCVEVKHRTGWSMPSAGCKGR